MDVRTFTVGAIAENCHIARVPGGAAAVIVDPGAEAERLLAAGDALGVTFEAILLTHTHFDHIGAVKAVHEATGAPVYCPLLEVESLANPRVIPGFPPVEPAEADETVEGGEVLQLAGLELEVLFTPGHSPGHVTYWSREHAAILSGDVLFQSSIGRTDLPGADHAVMMRTLAELLELLPDETVVYPGHMGVTTIGRERVANPFLQPLA